MKPIFQVILLILVFLTACASLEERDNKTQSGIANWGDDFSRFWKLEERVISLELNAG